MKRLVKLVIVLTLVCSSVLNFPASSFASSGDTSKLWNGPGNKAYYRIPAITTTNKGDILTVTDIRYGGAADLGNHQIDLLMKSSKNISKQVNLTSGLSTPTTGFGDTAIVADRNSDKVLILAAAGSQGYLASTRDNPIRVVKMVSNDGGDTFSKPIDITEQIYRLNDSWHGLFVTSGRIMQSRYVKVGDYHRLYTAILSRNETGKSSNANYVLYSDDFGDTWNILGGLVSPVPGGDEAKIEELPNGNVVISSRVGQGRMINIFTYDKSDSQYKSGTWEDKHQFLQLSNEGNATNGEILVVYARDKQTGKYTHLILQSLPTISYKYRQGVGIFYKAVDTSVSTVDQYKEGWSKDNFYMVQPGTSAYSTMTLQKDGTVGFLYEDTFVNDGYDIVYKKLDLETITNGKYENAFTGIGSADTPYVVVSEEQLEAKNSVFAKENVHWVFEGEAALINASNPVVDENVQMAVYGETNASNPVVVTVYGEKVTDKLNEKVVYITTNGSDPTAHTNLTPVTTDDTVKDGKLTPSPVLMNWINFIMKYHIQKYKHFLFFQFVNLD